MKTAFIADPHFDHEGVVSMSDRPFASIEEHNDVILDNINRFVEYQDRLFVLGDFAWRGAVGDYILMLEHYAGLARAAWNDNAGNHAALDVVRKVGGIAVKCMEDHGAIARQIPGVPRMSVGEVFAAARQHDDEMRRIRQSQQDAGCDEHGYLSR